MKDLESQLQQETARAELAERKNIELQEEHHAACDLVRSKDQLLELGLAEISQLKESLAQSTAQQEQQDIRWQLHYYNLIDVSFCLEAVMFFVFKLFGKSELTEFVVTNSATV